MGLEEGWEAKMLVCLVDTETTGLSYDEGARVIEIAAMLYDTQVSAAVESFSALIKHRENPAESVNGISVDLLDRCGLRSTFVFEQLLVMADQADCFVAHNAAFDRDFILKSLEADDRDDSGLRDRLVWGNSEGHPRTRPWVCTKTDIVWPSNRRGDSLVQLALSMGLGVASAHRAMADVDTMARILTRAQEIMLKDWLIAAYASRDLRATLPTNADFLEPLIRLGMRPKKRYVAKVPFDMNPVLKQNGFMWDATRKEWWREMPPEDAEKLAFRVAQRD